VPQGTSVPRRVADLLIKRGDFRAAVPWLLRSGSGQPHLDVARALLAGGDFARASKVASLTTKHGDTAYGEALVRVTAEMMAGKSADALRLLDEVELPPEPGPLLRLKLATLQRCLAGVAGGVDDISPRSDWLSGSLSCRLFELKRRYWTEGVAAGDRLAAPLVATHAYLRLSNEEDRWIASVCADAVPAP
jgi:hypothetical protein